MSTALSSEALRTIDGRLCEGCIVDSTCELVIAKLPGSVIDREFGAETGYEELIFRPL